ncbi:hypothetical protein ZIOFF_074456 (mitochondrion) [Zingiber officinale]|uniref:RNA dependent RNA polymerase n=1 Tax=Zingiber officinale TaxID=94328 RepID=A0A8J5CQ57_ZINOF|nr:hypothetical protein ZIOFF_075480 [Zingiber officinale]KAG6467661.1 hypothetical protein ZIOFF_074456 [Zingiber officinale]
MVPEFTARISRFVSIPIRFRYARQALSQTTNLSVQLLLPQQHIHRKRKICSLLRPVHFHKKLISNSKARVSLPLPVLVDQWVAAPANDLDPGEILPSMYAFWGETNDPTARIAEKQSGKPRAELVRFAIWIVPYDCSTSAKDIRFGFGDERNERQRRRAWTSRAETDWRFTQPSGAISRAQSEDKGDSQRPRHQATQTDRADGRVKGATEKLVQQQERSGPILVNKGQLMPGSKVRKQIQPDKTRGATEVTRSVPVSNSRRCEKRMLPENSSPFSKKKEEERAKRRVRAEERLVGSGRVGISSQSLSGRVFGAFATILCFFVFDGRAACSKRTSKATFESIIAPSRLSGAQVILNGEFKRLFPSFSACIFHGSPTFPFSRELVGNRLGNLLRTMTVGRLTCTLSGAGKRRLFAIGNFIKQRLLYPVHDWAMRVLSRIPTDGTFQQERPIHRLRQHSPSHILSLDLKSATDRWPCITIETIVQLFFGKSMAECVVRGCLQLNFFQIHRPLVRKARSVSFAAGQPLGYYGSWALFSLSHHYFVWYAAHLVYPRSRTPFRQYALLGDDIVISDTAVAKKYVDLLYFMGVDISSDKSLLSDNGSLEFAKQFWTDRVQVNLTPVSASAILASTSFTGLCQLAHKYGLSSNCLLRLAGMGFRARSRLLSPSLSRRWKRLRVISGKLLSNSSLPLSMWFGRGLPLCPYKKGIIVARALSRFMPKQLVIPPEESLWMTTEYDPDLDILFNPPIVPHSYKRNVPNQNETRYGFLWMCWEFAGEDINVGILDSTSALKTEGTDTNREINNSLCGESGFQPEVPQA